MSKNVAAEIRLIRQRVAALRKLMTDSLDALDQELSILDDDNLPSVQNRKDWSGFISQYEANKKSGA